MAAMMKGLRANPPTELAGKKVENIIDRLEPKYADIGQGDVLIFNLSPDNHTRVSIRPSGTEPKVKIYTQLYSPLDPNISDADLEAAKQESGQLAQQITTDLQHYTESLAS
jgi:phosphomannomutase